MDLQLSGQLALVTGSTSGIGKAVAKALLAEGAAVIVSSFSEAEVVRTVAELSPLGTVYGAVGDLSAAEGAEALAAQADRAGPVDILINNMGVNSEGAFADTDDAQWERAFQLNVMSAVRLSRHYLPQMLRRGTGRILFASSACGLEPMGNKVAYSVMKSAVLSLSRALAELTRGTEVTVNAVLPGPTLTEALRQQFGAELEAGEAEFFAARPSSLLGRFLTMEELARIYVCYASPLFLASNGAPIRADGGMIRGL